jgi:hypothetical protein
MKNSPVAWRIKDKDGKWLYYDEELVGTEPLYKYCNYDLNQQAQIDALRDQIKHLEAQVYGGVTK